MENTEYVITDKNFYEKSNPVYQVTLEDIRIFFCNSGERIDK
jgi:hypothetical protein